jgi:hypothetical protein
MAGLVEGGLSVVLNGVLPRTENGRGRYLLIDEGSDTNLGRKIGASPSKRVEQR